MKIKQQLDDFRVTERTRVTLDPRGRFALYRLTKYGLTTLEAVEILARLCRVSRSAVGFGGLKDKYGVTEQIVSLERGPARGVRQGRFHAEFLGFSREPIRRESFSGNDFVVVVRDLDAVEAAALRVRLGEVVRTGMPNYFDTQRFGSVRGAQAFAAKRLLLGDAEGALRSILAAPTRSDRRRQRAIRDVLARHWGDWSACRRSLPACSERSVVVYLEAHPADFRGAFERIERNLRNLYCSAYQSFIWNRILARLIRDRAGPAAVEVPYRLGSFVFYTTLPIAVVEALRALSIPAPRHDLQIERPEVARLFDQALAEEGIPLHAFRLRGLRDTYFKRGSRAALVFPEGLSADPDEPDDLQAGRRRVTLRFGLPRGSYATILIKRLLLESHGGAAARGEDDAPA